MNEVGNGVIQVIDGRIVSVREGIRLGSKIFHLLPQCSSILWTSALYVDKEIQIGMGVYCLFQILKSDLVIL